MQLNWIDWIIVGVSIYYLIRGWEIGLIYLATNLVSFLAALWLSIKYHAPVGAFFAEKFGVARVWTTVLGYIVVAFIAEAVISELLVLFARRIPKKLIASRANQWLGSVLSLANGLILITFFLLVVTVLPLRGTLKQDIAASRLARPLLALADRYGGNVRSTLDDATRQAIKFLTVQPESRERIVLEVVPSETELSVDIASEQRMVELVNEERAKAGVTALTISPEIIPVARAHSRDMFERKYFSHINPEGKDAGDRLNDAGITYVVAGENLAYAPDVETAHLGLMESQGHRENILEPRFREIGIGVIDGGIYGKMFTQNFTD
ncbi:CvpA family protein [Candidatus Gottesmanbacteria bacterium]|nr:CvpA family protein [Candidatus Gottesmanbacteria bacterium]